MPHKRTNTTTLTLNWADLKNYSHNSKEFDFSKIEQTIENLQIILWEWEKFDWKITNITDNLKEILLLSKKEVKSSSVRLDLRDVLWLLAVKTYGIQWSVNIEWARNSYNEKINGDVINNNIKFDVVNTNITWNVVNANIWWDTKNTTMFRQC